MPDRERSADARYRFNYSREEREGRSVRRAEQKRETLFSRHRGTIILLFDVMIIGVVFVVFRGFLMPEPHRDTLGGYEFELQAVADGEEVVVRVRVARSSEADAPGAAGSSGFFAVRVPADLELPELAELIDLVPQGDRPRIVHRRISREALPADTVTARVVLGGESASLSTSISR